MEIGRFYQRSGQWLAATYRFRGVVDQYQTTSHAPEALERLVECYLALGMPDEAWKASAVLGRNYAGTYWYRQSLRLLQMSREKPGCGPPRRRSRGRLPANRPRAPLRRMARKRAATLRARSRRPKSPMGSELTHARAKRVG